MGMPTSTSRPPLREILCWVLVKGRMESAIEELQRRHPNLDRMMCETLLKLHEQGELAKYVPKLDEKPPQPEVCILRDAITIKNNFYDNG